MPILIAKEQQLKDMIKKVNEDRDTIIITDDSGGSVILMAFYVLYSNNDKVVIYSFDDYKNNIDLGYALTIHKVQGNQFKYVFMPMVNSFYIMLNSKLIYTAVTRAIGQTFLSKESKDA